jgi:hypothetical protein
MRWLSSAVDVPWSKLKALGRPKVGRAALLVPVFGYLVLFNENVVKYLNLIPLFGTPYLDVGVSPRLLLLYYGACAISVVVALYSAFCPSQVTHYGNASAFAQGDGPGLKDFAMEEIEKDLCNGGYREDLQWIKDRYERNPSGGPKLTPTTEQKAEIDNGILHLRYKQLEYSVPWARISARILYAFGVLCLLLPTIQMFWRISVILATIAKSQVLSLIV